MITWKKLIEYTGSDVTRGSLLRFRAGEPFEDYVVVMVCEAPNDPSGVGLMTISGYKAGINCYVVFPSEATSYHLPTQWLVANWGTWVCPGGDVNDVEFHEPIDARDI